ncbi:hypothetical protein FA13DRAFT_1728108 [Coprinellus micaceus]|uniref:Uncharacterized protein n=1 Tax=Coprinellus micaceus TaxID=71717 RepID=A0A4Y7TP62_COPMI|nr:hypothetical protein FA13DRAFT_1728108 [Coprinellus micaceus]
MALGDRCSRPWQYGDHPSELPYAFMYRRVDDVKVKSRVGTEGSVERDPSRRFQGR